MLLQILLITDSSHYAVEHTMYYASASWAGPMTEDECWKTAAEINNNAPAKTDNQTAVCVPVIHPEAGKRGENDKGL